MEPKSWTENADEIARQRDVITQLRETLRTVLAKIGHGPDCASWRGSATGDPIETRCDCIRSVVRAALADAPALPDPRDAEIERMREQAHGYALRAHAALSANLALREPFRTLMVSLEWEQKRSGTTYQGYDDARAALAEGAGGGT